MTRVIWHLYNLPSESITDAFPSVEFVYLAPDAAPPDGLRADALFTLPFETAHLATLLDTAGLKWVHTMATGVERFPIALVPEDVLLSCSRGSAAIGISEWTLAMMLAFTKQLPGSWITEKPALWNTAELDGLHGRTVAILGMGSIGTEVARRCLAFGMHVRGMRRSPRPSPLDGVEIVGSAAEAVRGAHHVVIAAPATAETRHLVDANLLDEMQPGVHLVNIARGTLVDQDALRQALDRGQVARASLDTVDPEPLPKGHWLYSHPGVRLSPHISWSMPTGMDPIFETFTDNLRLLIAGQPLDNLVDRSAGY
jgi:phosphoglycerate dehydrogenase-like enzyme